jgi:rfaE bifunctional protein kinase chain/domain/rfaE bifunctional protein nucleotidyltransferase chain/domain
MTSYKILTLPSLLEKLDRSKKVILAHGCFDLVHPGHIRHLSYAKAKADILVASITSDRFITKGIYRPHVPQQIRAESLSALEMVDYVVITDAPDAIGLIKELKPDYFAKGFEYSDKHNPCTPTETSAVESYGGQMLFTPGDVVYSSTKLLNTHLPKLHIEKLISLMKRFDITFEGLRHAVSNFQNYHVHVVGDTIIDTYTRTNLIGSNAKTPTFSVLYDGHQDYVGGAAIVAQHLAAAGAQVTFTTVLGNDKYGILARKIDGIKINAIIDETRPTTNKNTIISGNSRLLKIDTLDNAPISSRVAHEITTDIKETDADCIVFSDFRHGIFSKATIKNFINAMPKETFSVADSQVASRWGNITEFKGFDLITPNEKEARFALADQDSNIGNLATNTKEAASAKNIILKLGERGVFFLENGLPYSVDSFAVNIKDAVGSGDALLAYATLTMLAAKSLPMACIIGSMAAACECELDGNIPVKPDDVLRKLSQYE